MFQIDESIPAKKLTSYLQNETTFLKDLKTIEGIEVAGEGNMNVVLRVKTSDKNFILKQSRPCVNKIFTKKRFLQTILKIRFYVN